MSTMGDLSGTFDDIGTAREKNTLGSWGAVISDGVGLGLDNYGIKGDFDDFIGRTPRYESIQEIQNSQQNEIDDMANTLNSRRQMEIDTQNTCYQNKMNEIQIDIRRVENGEITPPVGIDREDWLRGVNRTMEEEVTYNANVLSEIRDKYRGEMQERISEIVKKYSWEKRNLILKMILDKVDNIR